MLFTVPITMISITMARPTMAGPTKGGHTTAAFTEAEGETAGVAPMLISAFRPVVVRVHLPIAAVAGFLPLEPSLTLVGHHHFLGLKTLQRVRF
jgi:hypothetical protein